MNASIEGTRDYSSRFLRRDFRSRVRPNEFHVASFNAVEGVTAADIEMGTFNIDLNTDGIGSTADLTWELTMTNTLDRRVPAVLLQYGLRVDGVGRDWQVIEVGDLAPKEKKRPVGDLKARHDALFEVGNLQFEAAVFVGDTKHWYDGYTADWRELT